MELLRSALDQIHQLGAWGPVMFILTYILACVLLVPASILTLGAGLLFGVVWGSIYVSVAATLGASCAFLIGRYLVRDWVSRKIAANPRFKVIDDAVAVEGWKIVGLLRLSPLFPFNLLNYALGLTRVSFRDYFFASWIGMLPGTVMYVYAGSLAGDLASVGKEGRPRTTAEWTFSGIGLLATILVTACVARFAKRAFARKITA